MKNEFTRLYLVSSAILATGFLEVIFKGTKANTAGKFNFGILNLFAGALFLIFTIAFHMKYNANRKQLEKEMSKEYDERYHLIEGKASHFTISVLIAVTLIMMTLSRLISIPTNVALFIIMIFCAITNVLARKYYDHII